MLPSQFSPVPRGPFQYVNSDITSLLSIFPQITILNSSSAHCFCFVVSVFIGKSSIFPNNPFHPLSLCIYFLAFFLIFIVLVCFHLFFNVFSLKMYIFILIYFYWMPCNLDFIVDMILSLFSSFISHFIFLLSFYTHFCSQFLNFWLRMFCRPLQAV